VNKLFSITDVVMIGDRLSTILAEARNKTDMRLQVNFATSEDGTPFERYAVVMQVGPGHRQHFEIGERDFKFLHWTGIDVEVVAGPKAVENLTVSCADAPRRTLNRQHSNTDQLLTTA
jgi:hypothetical protein